MFQDTGLINKYKLPKPAFAPDPAPPAVEAYLSIIIICYPYPYLSMVESVRLARFDSVEQQQQHLPNLSFAQRQALRELRQDKTCVIKPDDKNLGLTVMRAVDYHAAVQAHVADTTVYQDVTGNVTAVTESACNVLRHLVTVYPIYNESLFRGQFE